MDWRKQAETKSLGKHQSMQLFFTRARIWAIYHLPCHDWHVSVLMAVAKEIQEGLQFIPYFQLIKLFLFLQNGPKVTVNYCVKVLTKEIIKYGRIEIWYNF